MENKLDVFIYNNMSNSVQSDISYATDEDSLTADGRVSTCSYKVNGAEKAETQNRYVDNYKRLTAKLVIMGGYTYDKGFTYDKTRVSKVMDVKNGSILHEVSYAYDDMGRITGESDSINTSFNNTYRYDSFGQLIREDNKQLDKTFVYEYDNIGNITKVKEYAYTTAGTPTGTATETVYTYDSTQRDRLTSFGGTSINYNSIGCPTTYDGYTATWTRGKLTKLTKGSRITGTHTYSYTYNAFGQRTGTNYNYTAGTSPASALIKGMLTSYSHTLDYDRSGRLICESKISQYYGEESGTEKKVYLYDEAGIIGMVYTAVSGATTTYYFMRNLFGDVIGIYNSSGTKVGGYAYDAWGNCTITLNTGGIAVRNPIRYRGYYYDEDTKLYYLNARYYCPKYRRFISPDDTAYLDPENVNGLNLYTYCNNDPVNYVDPSGHAWYHWAIGAGIIVLCAALTLATAGGFAAAGTAFASVVSATMAPTALSAVFAGATIGAAAIGTAGMVIGGMSVEDSWSWENASQGFMVGSIVGAIIGGTWGGTHYALQSAGKMVIRTNINNLVNNPLDEFVTVGPKDGGISGHVRSILQTGDYGQIFASKLPNGMYQIANGHHRVAALRQLGYRYVNFFLVP